jgi:hypothetical protein
MIENPLLAAIKPVLAAMPDMQPAAQAEPA